MGHSRSLYFFLFNTIVFVKILDDWIWTAALWCWKRPLYQLSLNHIHLYTPHPHFEALFTSVGYLLLIILSEVNISKPKISFFRLTLESDLIVPILDFLHILFEAKKGWTRNVFPDQNFKWAFGQIYKMNISATSGNRTRGLSIIINRTNPSTTVKS